MLLEQELQTSDFDGEICNESPDFDIFTIASLREVDATEIPSEQIPLLNEFVQRNWITNDRKVSSAVVKAYEKSRRELPDVATLFHLEALVNVRLQKISNKDILTEYAETIKRHFLDRARNDTHLNTERAFVSKNVDLNQLSGPRR